MHSVLIIGASRGLGLELVKQFLNHPTAKPEIVIATARSIKKSKELLSLSEKDKRLRILELDVTRYETFTAFVWKVSEIVGNKGLNILFNNAGILLSKGGTLLDISADIYQAHFKTNTIAPILLTKAFIPLLKKAADANKTKPFGVNRAAIIYMSSIMGSVGTEIDFDSQYWGYRESKAALNMAIRTITKELNSDGIAVLAVHPGWVRTDAGGPKAPLSPKESIEGLMKVIMALNENTNGGFIQYDKTYLPWY